MDNCRSTFRIRSALLLAAIFAPLVASAQNFTAFESEQFRPLAMSADGSRLFALNTPDNRLEVFTVTSTGLRQQGSVVVGLEPVAVGVRNNSEVWVVNHLSDSVSIVDVTGATPRVTRTLFVGDEPRDIVFAGPGNNRAFITAAHRGQNSPYNDPTNPGQLATPGVGRADVWVFDAANLGTTLGGTPLTIVTHFGDTAGALARSADGSTVYSSVFKSGNRTTTINTHLVCDGGQNAGPCVPSSGEAQAPGGTPGPNTDANGVVQPEVGIIVRHDGTAWRDALGRDWSNLVRFNLPDLDVFAIDATAGVPAEVDSFATVGTVLFGMAVNPASGRLYVSNTEAMNHVRFAGPRPAGSTIPTVQGNVAQARVTVIDPAVGSVAPRHLNTHIDYSVVPSPPGVRERSLSMPTGMAVTANGATLYVAAKGSSRVGVFSTAELEAGTFVPDAADHILLAGGGPTGLVLDEARNRLYVLTRFNNSIAEVDTLTRTQIGNVALFNPEPAAVVAGRPFLYDAFHTSSNGESSCGSCHVAGDVDQIAWDLGNPLGVTTVNPNPFNLFPAQRNFHPLKGPQTTQTLRGIDTHGPMHWRGDQTGGAGPAAGDEAAAFRAFNDAFVGALGRDAPLPAAEMEAFTQFALQLRMPPNPIRNLDNSLTPMQSAGRDFYFNFSVLAGIRTCNGCHVLNPAQGFFGTDGRSSPGGDPGPWKIAQLRSIYDKVGRFGMPQDGAHFPLPAANRAHQGDQIRGYGFGHDGTISTIMDFMHLRPFSFPGGDNQRRQVEQFLFAYDSNLLPVVGQQVTLAATSGPDIDARVNLLVARAAAGDAGLVVKGRVGGEERGWHRISSGMFQSDRAADLPISEAALRLLAQQAGQELTFTAVPPGTSQRIGIDRDQDTVLDNDDNCFAVPNLDQTDTDSNGVGDVCQSSAEADSDGDGMLDGWETDHGLNPSDPNDAGEDADGDGLSNLAEFTAGTSPSNIDSDGDLVNDGLELNVFNTDPMSGDTDGDQLPDHWELAHGLNPNNPADASSDADGDGLTALAELQGGSDPNARTNEAPLVAAGADQTVQLPDGVVLTGTVNDDGLPVTPGATAVYWSVVGPGPVTFGDETTEGTSATFSVAGNYRFRLSATDGAAGAFEELEVTVGCAGDFDCDGLTDAFENQFGLEAQDGSDAGLDSDSDGLSNLEEQAVGTDPTSPDTDGDTLTDGLEVNVLETDPNVPN